MAELAKMESGAEDDEAVIEMDNLATGEDAFMAPFFQAVAEIRSNIAKIEDHIKEIQEMHHQALAAYQSRKDHESTQRLDELMMEVTALGNKTRARLKSLDAENKKIEDSQRGSVSSRIRVSQHATISRKFIEVMERYNTVQTTYKKKYRERIVRQFKIVKQEATPEEVERVLEGEVSDDIFAQQISQSSEEAKQRLEDIQDRHKDIVKLEKSIQELHELFQDMAILVNRQGEMINQIEFQVSQAAEHVGGATQELREAKKIQDKVRRNQICLIVCCAILITVLIVVLITQLK